MTPSYFIACGLWGWVAADIRRACSMPTWAGYTLMIFGSLLIYTLDKVIAK